MKFELQSTRRARMWGVVLLQMVVICGLGSTIIIQAFRSWISDAPVAVVEDAEPKGWALQTKSVVKTKIPMYYTNLEKSTARRHHMERTFGDWGVLRRTQAVDVTDPDSVQTNIDTHGMTAKKYFEQVKATGPGAGALMASIMKSIMHAYDNQEEYMLLFEDDVSDILVPYWRWSLDEIAELADKEHPGWLNIQLQVQFNEKFVGLYQGWKIDPSTPFFARTSLPSFIRPWGCAAVMYSRAGMKDLIDRLMVGEGGKFDCMPEVEKLNKKYGVRCHPDDFMWRLPEPEKRMLVLPPMFTVLVNEGSTGIRKGGSYGIKNDLETGHYRGILNSVKANVLAKAELTFKEDMQLNVTAAEAGMWYMQPDRYLKKMLEKQPPTDGEKNVKSDPKKDTKSDTKKDTKTDTKTDTKADRIKKILRAEQ